MPIHSSPKSWCESVSAGAMAYITLLFIAVMGYQAWLDHQTLLEAKRAALYFSESNALVMCLHVDDQITLENNSNDCDPYARGDDWNTVQVDCSI